MMTKPKTFYNRLGLRSNATEAKVRSAYKTLALQQHPDKFAESDRKQATEAFQQLQEAYNFCLSAAQSRSGVDVDWENFYTDTEDDDNDSDWRRRLPLGIGGSGPWWNELNGDEPTTVLHWAHVCEKAVQNASRFSSMSETEQDLFNKEYDLAGRRFETWRQKHIEKFEQEDRLQQTISDLPERLCHHTRAKLEELRSSNEYI